MLREFAREVSRLLEAGDALVSVVTYNNITTRTVFFGLASTDEMDIIFGYAY